MTETENPVHPQATATRPAGRPGGGMAEPSGRLRTMLDLLVPS